MSRTTSPSEHDYAAIEAAVMETERGRWFLAEHAARHRVADTEAILTAIGRMEVAAPAVPAPVQDGLKDVGAILAIARAAARGNAAESHPPHLRPMQVADGAITAVRRVAEKIQKVAYELRENAGAPMYAEALDLYCRDLESASALQEKAILQLAELAGVVDAIEEKLATMVARLPRSGRPGAAVSVPPPFTEPAAPAIPAPGAAAGTPPVAVAGNPSDAAARSVEAPPIQPEASPAPPAKELPRRTLLLVQPVGPKR